MVIKVYKKLIKIFKVLKKEYEKQSPIMFANKIGVNVGKDCKFINSPNWGSEP